MYSKNTETNCAPLLESTEFGISSGKNQELSAAVAKTLPVVFFNYTALEYLEYRSVVTRMSVRPDFVFERPVIRSMATSSIGPVGENNLTGFCFFLSVPRD